MTIAEPIPDTPDKLTPAFFSQVLNLTVDAVRLARIGEDEGFTGGGLFRVELVYADQAGPKTLVAKFSPSDPVLRATMATANEREVNFYNRVSGHSNLPVPKCYFGAFDPENCASLLIVEDLGGHQSVAFLDACDAGQASDVVRSLADIHAEFWDDNALKRQNGTEILTEFDFQAASRSYRSCVAKLLPEIDVPQTFWDICDFLTKNDVALVSYLFGSAPITLTHRDIHVDNVLFGIKPNTDAAVLLDWQLCGPGKGVSDLTYFLISSLNPDLRQKVETTMLTDYHNALVRNGVVGYEFCELQKDYVVSVLGKIIVTIIATVLLDNSTPHKTAYRAADLNRLLAFCADHNVTPETFAFILD